MTSNLSTIIDEIIRVTGNEKLRTDVDRILEKHEFLIDRIDNAPSIDSINDVIRSEEQNLETDVDWARQVAAAMEQKWIAETERKIADTKLSELNFAKLQKEVHDTLAKDGTAFPYDERGDDNDSLTAVRRDVLAQRLSTLRRGIETMRSRLRQYRRSKQWRSLKSTGFDFFWDLGFPLVFFALSLPSFVLGPIAGLILCAVLTLLAWAISRWMFKPWLDHRILDRRRRDTHQTINSFYFTMVLVLCQIAAFEHVVDTATDLRHNQ